MTEGLSLAGLARPTDALFERTGQDLADARAAVERSPEDAALRFQHLLSSMLVRELRKTLPEGFFGGAVGGDTFEGWLDDHLGRVLAEQDALGLAGLVKSSLPGGGEPTADTASPAGGGDDR